MEHRRVPIADRSDPAAARRLAEALAAAQGLEPAAVGRVAIVATELATNLVKHAGGGEMLLRALNEEGQGGVEIVALDRGAGMKSVLECQRDGYSTSGSVGIGLGAVLRLGNMVDVYSWPGRGTAVLARVTAAPPGARADRPSIGVGGICVSMSGQESCGDDWAVARDGAGTNIVVADGLGHGPSAAEAARQAVRVFHERVAQSPGDVLEATHAALRATRGAAVAVVAIDAGRALVRFAGVGNIGATVVSAVGTRSLVSHNGIVGHRMRTVQEFTCPWPSDGLAVLHSDGLQTHWKLDAYPDLAQRHPSLIAGVLYRDFARGRDDVTVVVAKQFAA